jgi:cyanophycinase
MIVGFDIKGYIALVGGNEWSQGCDFDTWLAQRINATSVVVLPTAAAFERPELAVENAKAYFSEFDIKVTPVMILHRQDAFNDELVDQIAMAKFLYISGGSPLHLKSVLKDTPLYQAISSVAAKNNTVLAASSAAAMVLGDPMVDPRGGAFTLGLGLIPGLSVLPHFNSWTESRIKRSLMFAPPEVWLAGIDEKTALIRLPDKTWKSMGEGKVKLFKSGQELPLDQLSL